MITSLDERFTVREPMRKENKLGARKEELQEDEMLWLIILV